MIVTEYFLYYRPQMNRLAILLARGNFSLGMYYFVYGNTILCTLLSRSFVSRSLAFDCGGLFYFVVTAAQIQPQLRRSYISNSSWRVVAEHRSTKTISSFHLPLQSLGRHVISGITSIRQQHPSDIISLLSNDQWFSCRWQPFQNSP